MKSGCCDRRDAGKGWVVPAQWLHFPVWQSYFRKEAVYEWRLFLKVRMSSGTFTSLTFLVDTGTQLTTIPIPTAEQRQIPFDRQRPVTIHGTTGTGHGFVGPMWFSLADLPEYQFESLCCFSTAPLPSPLLSLKDLITHFRMRTLLPSHKHPLGSLLLQLHRQHKGQPLG